MRTFVGITGNHDIYLLIINQLTTMKKQKNNFMRLILLVLIAVFVPNMANAQFGGLKKAMKNAVKNTTSSVVNDAKESATASESVTSSSDPYGGNQVEQMKQRKREASEKQNADREARKKAGCKIIECRRNNQIGSWHSSENKMVSMVDNETYIFDAAAGNIHTESGKTVATLSNGVLDIPNINAKVKINSTGGVEINGESCGKATRQDLYIYGRRLGNIFCEAPREMVVFFLLTQTPYGTPEARANMRRTQYMDGTFLDASGARIGYIKGGQIINNNRLFPKQGNLHYDDDETVIADNNYRVGALLYDGTVNDNSGNKIGQVKENGDIINISGKKVAHVDAKGKITNSAGKFLVQFSGERPVVAAVLYYFFFKDKIK